MIHGLKHAIKWRYLHPAEAVPPLPASLTQFLHTPAAAEARARPARDACAAVFGRATPGRARAEAAPRAAAGADVKAEPATDVKADVTPHGDEGGAARGAHARTVVPTPTGVAVGTLGEIRLAHAVHDFEALLHDTDAVSETCAAMSAVLLRLVAMTPIDIPLLVRALHAYRSAAAEVRSAADADGRGARVQRVRTCADADSGGAFRRRRRRTARRWCRCCVGAWTWAC